MNALTERLQTLLARLSRRERLLVGGAGLALVLLIALLVVVNVQAALSDRRSRIEYKREGIEQVVQLSSGFREAQAERRRLEARLRGSKDVSLFSLLEDLAKKEGVAISNMTPRQPTTEGGITEQTVDVTLEDVTLDKLAGMINGLQRTPGVVRLKRLRVRKKLNAEDAVDASLQVATYSLAG